MDKKEILDIISAAEKYVKKLHTLEERNKRAEQQIKVSGNESLQNIESFFDNMKQSVIKALDVRKSQLINDIEKVQNDGIKPLRECTDVIFGNIKKTNNLIEQGNDILKSTSLNASSNNFYLQSNILGNLPAVPSLEEVPYIHFTSSVTFQQDITNICNNIGTVYYQAPVKISALIPKPGSILLQWEENDTNDDRLANTYEFRVQFAFGNILQNPDFPLHFNDCYIGPNTEYTKKDLKLNQFYTFRVCCKLDGSSEWSPWSLPQIAQTTIKPFTWDRTQKHFSLNNENKLATKSVKEHAILLSSGPQFQPNYSVEFTILEMDSCYEDCLVGLCDEVFVKMLNTDNVCNINTFTVSVNGIVHVGEEKKSTRLPNLKPGSKISFTCEKANEKVRICVESEEKNVTYDWKLTNSQNMYFFVLSESPNFKILVE